MNTLKGLWILVCLCVGSFVITSIAVALDPVPDVSQITTSTIKAQMGELVTANIQLRAQVDELQRDLTVWHERAMSCQKQLKK